MLCFLNVCQILATTDSHTIKVFFWVSHDKKLKKKRKGNYILSNFVFWLPDEIATYYPLLEFELNAVPGSH